MQLLSEFIGKQIIKGNGEYSGYVTKAELSKKLDAVRAFTCSDADENEFSLPVCAIKAVGDGAVIVKSLGGKLAKERVSAPIGCKVLNVDGNLLGLLTDFEIENYKVFSIILSNGDTFPLYKIKGLGECIIIDENAVKPEIKSKKDVKAQPAKQTEQLLIETAPKAENDKITAGSNLLTGKSVPKDILDVRGNLIIKKGSVITPEILKSAVIHNKLFELTVTVLNA